MRKHLNLIMGVILGLLLVPGLYSQKSDSAQTEGDFELHNYVEVPNSPEAAAFTKYGNTSINLYTGTPDINIPLYQINSGGISVPISLSYDAAGIKVDQISTWVGLGWNLNVGGMVTRQVMGVPDDAGLIFNPYHPEVRAYSDYIHEHGMGPKSYHDSAQDILPFFTWADRITRKQADFEPDLFPFHVNGLSGTFYIDLKTKQPKCIEHPDLLIELIGDPVDLRGWIITDTSGMQYIFRETEITQNTYSGSTTTMFDGGTDLEYTNRYISAWKLSLIKNLSNNETVNFEYTSKTRTEKEVLSREGSRTNIPYTTNTCTQSETRNDMDINDYQIMSSDLREIRFKNNRVTFNRAEGFRKDYHNKKALRSIKVATGPKKVTEIILYNDSYFGNPTSADQVDSRLKLDSISISNYSKKYKFTYDRPHLVPSRDSKSVDFWGYYNGKSNSTLIPAMGRTNGFPYTLTGGNRSVDQETTTIGTLTKIQYPTGGFTTYTYGLNKLPSTYTSNPIWVSDANTPSVGSGSPLYPGFCDDSPTNPRYASGSFIIKPGEEGTLVTIEIGYSGDPNYDYGENTAQSYVVYKTREADQLHCVPADSYDCKAGPVLEYCENFVYSNTANVVRAGGYNANKSITKVLAGTLFDDQGNVIDSGPSLSPGAYRYYMFNNHPKVTMHFGKERIEYKQIEHKNYLGGLRVLKTTDYTEENAIALQKAYIYDDVSVTKDIRLDALGSYEKTSGVQHRDMEYYSTYRTENYSNTEGNYGCAAIVRYAHNRSTPTPVDIGYSTVTELTYNGQEYNGMKVYDFYNELENAPNKQFSKTELLNGKLIKERVYDKNYTLLQKKEYTYSQKGEHGTLDQKGFSYGISLSSDHTMRRARVFQYTDDGKAYYTYEHYLPSVIPSFFTQPGTYLKFGDNIPDYKVNYNTASTYWTRLEETKETHYKDGEALTTTTTYNYGNQHYAATSTRITKSDQEPTTTQMYYPKDLGLTTLLLQNRIASPVTTKSYVTEDNTSYLVATAHQAYATYGNLYLPSKVQTAKGGDQLQDRVVFTRYNEQGNPRELTKPDGTPVVYIWGYWGQHPIAKIERATYDQVASYEADLITLSNSDIDRTHGYAGSEGALRQALDNLRQALPNAMVSTYTYDPLIGVTSMTDPLGQTNYYTYDHMNRFGHAADIDNHVITKYNYNYKGEKGQGFDPMQAVLIVPSHIEINKPQVIAVDVSAGSGKFLYEWQINGQTLSESGNSFTHTFTTLGNYPIQCKVTDRATNEVKIVTTNVQVINSLTIPKLTANPVHSVENTLVNFSLTGIAGGSGEYIYTWYVNSAKQNETGTTMKSVFTPGTYTVKVAVEDLHVADFYREASTTVYAYEALTTPILHVNRTPATTSNIVHFTTSGVSKGSGDYTYEWYVHGVKQSATGTSLDHRFTSPGTYTVNFRVVDNKIPNHVTNATAEVEVFAPLDFTIASNYTHMVKGTNVIFSTNKTGGSGHYTYLWKVDDANVTTDAGFNRTFNSLGTYTVSCTINDTRTGQSLTKTKTMHVHNPLLYPTLTFSPLSHRNQGQNGHFITSTSVTFTGGNFGGGSGSRSYVWLINGFTQSHPLTATTFTKVFSTPGTYTVTFRVRDDKIPGEYKEKSVTIRSYRPVTIDNLGFDQTNFHTTARNGSGSYRYEWFVNTTSGNPYQATSSKTYAHEYTATTGSNQTIYCRVVDLKSGYITRFKSRTEYFQGVRDTGGGGGDNGDGRGKDPVGGDQ